MGWIERHKRCMEVGQDKDDENFGRLFEMGKVTIFFLLLALLVSSVSVAHGALVFNLDFDQDGIYEVSWMLKGGESVSIDVYVSNVPAPGLGAMGFKMVYDDSKLQVVPAGTGVDSSNWAVPYLDLATTGEIQMAGFRTESGISGNNIRLGRIELQCEDQGVSQIRLLDRGETVDCFVLADDPEDPTVLDGDFGDGIFLVAEIKPPVPGDINGDTVVDLADGILALKIMGGMDPEDAKSNADVNGDDKIALQEAIYILQKVSGLR